MKKRRPLTTEEHLEAEVEAAEPAKRTGTAVEAGEPLTPLLKAELPVRRFARELRDDGIEDAHLDAEEMSLVCRCDSGTIDLLLDTSTVSNLVPEEQRDVVQDIRSERTALMGVGGARVLATETGEAGVFGKSRIVPGSGAICISQR